MLGAAEAGGAGCSTSPTAAAGPGAAVGGGSGGCGAPNRAGVPGMGRIGFDPSLGEERLQEVSLLQLAGLGRMLGGCCARAGAGGCSAAACVHGWVLCVCVRVCVCVCVSHR